MNVSFPWLVMQVYLSKRVCPKITANTCCWGRSPPWICSVTHLVHPKRRILSSKTIGTIPSIRTCALIGVCCLFGSLSQFLVVIARSRLANLFWHLSSGENSLSVELPSVLQKARKPDNKAPCMVALKTLHLTLKSTCGFQN